MLFKMSLRKEEQHYENSPFFSSLEACLQAISHMPYTLKPLNEL